MLQLKASQNDGASENLKNEFVVLFFSKCLEIIVIFSVFNNYQTGHS